MERWSERFLPTGSYVAAAVLDQLGRPDIHPLEVLVREALQNCWDAKRPDADEVEVSIARKTLAPETASLLMREVLPDPPPGVNIRDAIERNPGLLMFSDFGTHGLAGNSHAGLVVEEGEPTDFADFVRNIGQRPDKEFGGGSFGYGKAAFYIASEANTVIIDTLCEFRGKLERRLIAYAIGGQFHDGVTSFTGRHWWGRVVDDIPEPLVGEEAERVADALGFPSRSGGSGIGTTIAILAPNSFTTGDGDELSDPMRFIADCVTWNFWPIQLATGGLERLSVRVWDDESEIELDDPRTHTVLRRFAKAMDVLRGEDVADGAFVVEKAVHNLRPKKLLGTAVISKFPRSSVNDESHVLLPNGAKELRKGVHHVVLMREAELVVDYLAGSPPGPEADYEYAGVFKCDREVDGSFKRSEPPTHDRWNPEALTDPLDKRYVKKALDETRSFMKSVAGVVSPIPTIRSGDAVPLGEISDAMSALIVGVPGGGARSGGGRPPKPKVVTPGPPPPPNGAAGVWTDGSDGAPNDGEPEGRTPGEDNGKNGEPVTEPAPPPQTRVAAPPELGVDEVGRPIVTYLFDLNTHGHDVELVGRIEVMTNDGEQADSDEPQIGTEFELPAWISPEGIRHEGVSCRAAADDGDGRWVLTISLLEPVMTRASVAARRLT